MPFTVETVYELQNLESERRQEEAGPDGRKTLPSSKR